MRTRENGKVETFEWSNGSFDLMTSYKKISDVNNGRKGPRPESPCHHIDSRLTLIPVPEANSPGYLTVLPMNANEYAAYAESLASEGMSKHSEKFLSHVQDKIDQQIGGFSSLNFLYELRELPDLFKKLKTPEDLRYIDYAFAILPLIADIKAGLHAYKNRASSMNEKLKQFRSLPLARTLRTAVNRDGLVSYTAGNGQRQYDTLRLTSRLKGSIEMDVPWLTGVCPDLYMILDSLSVDVSASNAWNALPWSWFVDWFVPFGTYLETLPSVMKPACRFVGTVSHHITFVSDLESAKTGPSYFYQGGWPAGQAQCETYIREAYAGPTSSLHKWTYSPISSPHQIALLRDIMFPADIRRGKSVFR